MKKVLLLFEISFVILSCNSTKEELPPTEELAKQEVMESIRLESENKVELLEFKKTNAVKEKVFEVDTYRIDFEGKISYKQNGYSLIYEDYNNGKKGFLLVRSDKPLFNSSYNYYGEVKKGEKKQIKGNISFIKKENGWDKADVKMFLVNRVK